MYFENTKNSENNFKILFDKAILRGSDTEFELYTTKRGWNRDKFKNWKFSTNQDWYEFIQDDMTNNIYRGNIFTIGKGNQEYSFLTFNPEKKQFANKPTEYPGAKLQDDGKYMVTLFEVDPP